MMRISMIFVIFVTVKLSDVQSEFVTLWTPKFVQEDAVYRLFALPTDLTENTEIAVQFRAANATFTLTSEKIGAIEYGSKERNFGDIKAYNLTMTLLRNVSTSSGTEMHCSTKNIPVETKTGNFYNFIQTDKPIYKPGDEVQFRILTVDKDLLPYHRDSINVTITDPAGRILYNFKNQEDKYIGVFDDKFTLSTETTLGDWMITVVVDRKDKMAVSKIFAVQKYTLPLFDAHIDIPEVHYLKEVDVTFSVYGKYSFGEYVKGTADVTIRGAKDKHEYFRQSYEDVQDPKVIVRNLKSIGVETLEELQLEIVLVFTEPASGIHMNKTIPIFIHADDQHKIVAVHSEKFLPGLPFVVKIFIYNWKNEQLMTYFEKIDLKYSFILTNGSSGFLDNLGKLENGVYVNEFPVPKTYTALTVDIMFTDSDPYHKEIEMGTVDVGINSLIVDHTPLNPSNDDTVKIFVTSDQPLNEIIYAIVTRYGNTDSKQIDCKGQLICDFDVDMDETMMPHSTIMVYDVKDKQTIFQGKTKIETTNLGDNYLTVELPTAKAKTRESVNMKFATKAKSKVYMLAFDKRLTFLRDGNDIVKDDIMKSVADYDGENKILVDDLSSWKVCTSEEVKRVESGRTYVINQGGTDTVYPDEPDDPSSPDNANPSNPDLPPTKDGLLREYFPETWIFETIEVGKKSTFEKAYTTPDSMTTWLISAFSVHKDHGIALSPRQDLIVMDEFFVELKLPYSIRYTEVLKLEVLVFNYIDTKESLSVDIQLNNIHDGMEFQFVDYSSDCKPSYHDGPSATSKVTVEANGMSTIHFYIRSNPLNNTFDDTEQKLMTIDVEATGKSNCGRTYRDHLQKELIVDPVGIKLYTVDSEVFKLDGGKPQSQVQQTNFSQDLSSIEVTITGDYFANMLKVEKQFSINELDFYFDDTDKLLVNTAVYQYFNVKGQNPSKTDFNNQYQTLLIQAEGKDANKKIYGDLAYLNTSIYKSSFGNAVVTAMVTGLIPEDKKLVFEYLDAVRDLQLSNGTYDSDQFYILNYKYIFRNGSDSDYMYTERYFAAAFCLIPVVKHKTFMDGRYDEFIKKGFRYLDDDINRLQVARNGLSIAAYVYAMDNQTEKAKSFLKEIEKSYEDYEDNKRCYKVLETDTFCDPIHTYFVAKTYITLNDLVAAEPISYYLLSLKHDLDDLNSRYNSMNNTNVNGISVNFLVQIIIDPLILEPAALIGALINTKDTNLKITVQNEGAFKQDFAVTVDNEATLQTIKMPSGSQQVSSVISGQGFCTISSIFERVVTVPLVENAFSISLTTQKVSDSPIVNSVQICVTYNLQNGWKPILNSVVYEVEMPSGYSFKDHVDQQQTNLKEVKSRRQGALVTAQFDDFEADTSYCVKLDAFQLNKVNEAAFAGVKVYDFSNKERVAVDFYKFETNTC